MRSHTLYVGVHHVFLGHIVVSWLGLWDAKLCTSIGVFCPFVSWCSDNWSGCCTRFRGWAKIGPQIVQLSIVQLPRLLKKIGTILSLLNYWRFKLHAAQKNQNEPRPFSFVEFIFQHNRHASGYHRLVSCWQLAQQHPTTDEFSETKCVCRSLNNGRCKPRVSIGLQSRPAHLYFFFFFL